MPNTWLLGVLSALEALPTPAQRGGATKNVFADNMLLDAFDADPRPDAPSDAPDKAGKSALKAARAVAEQRDGLLAEGVEGYAEAVRKLESGSVAIAAYAVLYIGGRLSLTGHKRERSAELQPPALLPIVGHTDAPSPTPPVEQAPATSPAPSSIRLVISPRPKYTHTPYSSLDVEVEDEVDDKYHDKYLAAVGEATTREASLLLHIQDMQRQLRDAQQEAAHQRFMREHCERCWVQQLNVAQSSIGQCEDALHCAPYVYAVIDEDVPQGHADQWQLDLRYACGKAKVALARMQHYKDPELSIGAHHI